MQSEYKGKRVRLKNWTGSEWTFYFWASITTLSILLTIYGTYFALISELNYDFVNPAQAVINPFLNYFVLVVLSDFFLFGMQLIFLFRLRIGSWALLFTLFPAILLFISFLQNIAIMLLASVINLFLLFPVFRNIMK